MKRIVTFLTLSLVALSSQAFSLFDFSDGNDYTETKYPIVLVHGIFGYDSIGSVDYFYGIPQALSKSGAKVFVAEVSPMNSTEFRGEQLLKQVEIVLAKTGAEKVNLIAHSHGGPTARYVASVAPEFVASVTSIGGVNKGSRIADLVRNTVSEDSVTETMIATASKGITILLGIMSNSDALPEDSLAALDSLTTATTLAFNEKYPEGVPTSDCGNGDFLADNGVYYYSWTGASSVTNVLDPTDAGFALTGLVYGGPSDGVVGVCSAHLGKVIRDDYKMNHMDEVNQMFGLHHLFETDPKTLYRQHANRLQLQGL
jgi:triacylglycerol lipase